MSHITEDSEQNHITDNLKMDSVIEDPKASTTTDDLRTLHGINKSISNV